MLRGQKGSERNPNDDLLGEGQSPDSPLGSCPLPFAAPAGGRAHPRFVTCSPWQWGAVLPPQPGPGPVPLPDPGGTATLLRCLRWLLQMSAQIPPYFPHFGLQSTTGSIQRENYFRTERKDVWDKPSFQRAFPNACISCWLLRQSGLISAWS